MKPMIPQLLEIPGKAVLQIDVNVALSNVMNVYVTGNRRGTFRSRVDDTLNGAMLARALRRPDEWEFDKLPEKPLDSRQRLAEMDEIVALYAEALLTPREMVLDVGAKNREALLQMGWENTYVVMPSTGYPRPYTALRVAPPGLNAGVTSLRAPCPSSEWARSVARTLLEIDRTRFDANLIPDLKSIPGTRHDPRSQPWGTYLALREQLRALQRVYTLYAVQASVFMLHVHRRWIDSCYTLAFATERRARVALEAWRDAYDALLAVPLHPLLSYIANGLNSATIMTYHGQRDLVVRATARPEHPRDPQPTPNGVIEPSDSEMRTVMLTEALKDFLTYTTHDAGGQAWDFDQLVPERAECVLSAGQLLRAVRSLTSVSEEWPAVASQLGWRSLTVSAGQVQSAGADFMLTDGFGYSDEPAGGVLGLRPVLSCGNVQLAGFTRRFDNAFNTGPNSITWSVMVVDGFQGDTGRPDALERFFLPTGMSMGEGDVLVIATTGSENDPLGQQTKAHFDTRSPRGYVAQYYGPAAQSNVVRDTSVFKQTAWDGTAEGVSAVAQSLFLDAFTGQVDPPGRYRLMQHTRFYHRVIVKLARPYEYEWYNEYGAYLYARDFDGAVAYDNTIDIRLPSAALEAIVQIAATAALPDVPDQIKTEG